VTSPPGVPAGRSCRRGNGDDTIAVHAKRHSGSWIRDAGCADTWCSHGRIGDAGRRHDNDRRAYRQLDWRIVDRGCAANPVSPWRDDRPACRHGELAVGRGANHA
jgi:hypothetical protein